ncbi:45967_t:CDS:1, partial [Gigaspora margarita]
LYDKVEYLKLYIKEIEYSRLGNESMYSRLEYKAIYSRLYDEDSKSIVEIKSDVYDGKVEYSRLGELKYSRECNNEKNS